MNCTSVCKLGEITQLNQIIKSAGYSQSLSSGWVSATLTRKLESKNIFHEFKMAIKRINFTVILFRVLGNY